MTFVEIKQKFETARQYLINSREKWRSEVADQEISEVNLYLGKCRILCEGRAKKLGEFIAQAILQEEGDEEALKAPKILYNDVDSQLELFMIEYNKLVDQETRLVEWQKHDFQTEFRPQTPRATNVIKMSKARLDKLRSKANSSPKQPRVVYHAKRIRKEKQTTPLAEITWCLSGENGSSQQEDTALNEADKDSSNAENQAECGKMARVDAEKRRISWSQNTVFWEGAVTPIRQVDQSESSTMNTMHAGHTPHHSSLSSSQFCAAAASATSSSLLRVVTASSAMKQKPGLATSSARPTKLTRKDTPRPRSARPSGVLMKKEGSSLLSALDVGDESEDAVRHYGASGIAASPLFLSSNRILEHKDEAAEDNVEDENQEEEAQII